MPFCIGEPVGIHYKGFAVVLGDHVEDDAGDDEQEAYDDEHDGTDQRGEVDDHAGAYEFGGDPSTQHDADDADDQAEGAEERQRLVFADHAEDGAHHLDAVTYRVQLGYGTFWPVAVLDGHFEQTQVVVQRVDGHLGLDLEAARKHGVGLDEGEVERAVSGHDVGDVRAEQPVDGAAHQTVAEIVERALVLLEVCGGEAVADDHIIAFEHFGDHGGRGVGRVGVVAICHDVYVRVDVLEHGADDVALALARLPADDRAFGLGDLGGAVRGVVVVHVDGRIRQGSLEVTNNLADGDLLVVTGKKHGNGKILILKLVRHEYNSSFWAGLQDMPIIVTNGD